MRKLLCFLLILTIVCCLFGCGQQKSAPDKTVNFYYCRENITFDGGNNVFAAEARTSVDAEDLVAVTNAHLQGPESRDLYSPYPMFTQILSIERTGTTLSVVFSPQLSQLTGPHLMLACACTAMTLFDMTQAETVIITADGVLLDGKESVMLTPNRLIFTDNQPPEASENNQ